MLAAWSEARVATFWHRRRQFEPVEIPDELLELVTRFEPYRRQALDDASTYLSLFCPLGLAPVVHVASHVVRPFEHWSHAIRGLEFRVESSDAMTIGSATTSWSERWDLVVLEEGRWKVASLWDPPTRRLQLAAAAEMKAAWARAKSCGRP